MTEPARADAAVAVRQAVAADAALLARHRAEMWREMGRLPDDVYPDARRDSEAWFARAIPAGTYVGWLAAPADRPREVVAGAGIVVRPIIPTVRPRAGRVISTDAPQGLVVNVFTERPWRRRGLGRLLMMRVIEGARALELSSLVLHASDDGRGLYEKVGFRQTNEMRFEGEL